MVDQLRMLTTQFPRPCKKNSNHLHPFVDTLMINTFKFHDIPIEYPLTLGYNLCVENPLSVNNNTQQKSQ